MKNIILDKPDAEAQNNQIKVLSGSLIFYDEKIQEAPVHDEKYWEQVNHTIDDLIKITQNNSNLTNTQKTEFTHSLKEVKALLQSNLEEAKKKLNQINLQIQLQQAQNALQSGFQAQEANKNLKAAESILNELKSNITDENLKKSFEKITTEVFWTGALIEGTHYLQLVEKVVKGWEITNKLEKYITEKFYNIVHNAQQQYIQDELVKIENEKKELIELGNKIFTIQEGGGISTFSYGDPKNDPTYMLAEEKEYELKHLFDEKRLTEKERINLEAEKYKQEYKKIMEMPEGEQKKEAAKKYWNELTSEMEDSYTKQRKWIHLERWEGGGQQRKDREVPYYVEEYDKYIKPNRREMDELANYHNNRANELKKVRRQLDIDKLIPYLKDEETGLYWYAGMLSPISLEDNPTIEYAAHEGSRYLEEEGYYRLHAGQDMGSSDGKIKGTNVHSLINGTFLAGNDFMVETGDGYAIRYRHMPPSSYEKYKTGDKIDVNDIVATVAGWGCQGGRCWDERYAPHLHFEILKKGVVINPETGEIEKDKNGFPKQAYNIALDPSQVEIKGGKIYEKK